MCLLIIPLNERRALHTRDLPDGRVLDVYPLMFGEARLCISQDREDQGAMDVWYYSHPLAALAAMMLWEPDQQPEPAGWYRHPFTNRYRLGGDPNQEQIGDPDT